MGNMVLAQVHLHGSNSTKLVADYYLGSSSSTLPDLASVLQTAGIVDLPQVCGQY